MCKGANQHPERWCAKAPTSSGHHDESGIGTERMAVLVVRAWHQGEKKARAVLVAGLSKHAEDCVRSCEQERERGRACGLCSGG